NPVSIAVGPDGALWFTEFDQGKIGRITTDGTIDDHYKLPPFGVSRGITTGPDGALWFTDCENNAIGRLQ
ncbi:MAG: Virginiamycin B lyase, partial [Candidatus Eremiobacteraeota bacterium]|nr:Virginiamycin B lyase [Candidatus Eremiobacteraeota bacterium]